MPISVKSSFDFSGYKLMLKPPACVQMLSFVKIITNISLLTMLAILLHYRLLVDVDTHQRVI